MTAPETTHTETSRWWIITFGVTILLSAFLLFQVQPVVSKAILPWFGGAPAVWTTCMLFFQTLLFGGYLYAHLLQRWLAPRHQVAVHLALVAVALAMLPVIPGADWKPGAAVNPTLQILLLLLATVGLPYFVLAATSPLVQAWFSGACPGRSPYRLYALSNAGSLAALLSYPFFFEPMFDLSIQSAMWSGAFVLYAALCAALLACVWQLRSGGNVSEDSVPSHGARSPLKKSVSESLGATAGLSSSAGRNTRGNTAGQASSGTLFQRAARPSWSDRLRWLALPACASLMLLAATNHVCQDVAVVPFLWVMPLSLYLLSFIICFDHARWYVRPLWAALAVLALGGVAVNDYLRVGWSPLGLMTELLLYFAALFFACMVCHGELVRLKPAPRYLTEFYLFISAGGALGGAFVAVVAPLAFSNYLEWPIGVAVTFVLSVGLLILPNSQLKKGATAGLPSSAGRNTQENTAGQASSGTRSLENRLFQRAAKSGRMIRLIAYAGFGFVVAVGLLYIAVWSGGLAGPLDPARNFFGVVAVVEINADDPQRHEFQLRHGRIIHGRQLADPEKRRWPTGYYGEQSGAGEAIRYCQKSGPVRVGLIGLGIGTLAAYARPDDVFRFYEINSEVVRMAKEHFTYLRDCRGECKVVLGDARLLLEAEPPQEYDVLVLDAFSGDAIPTHLLTREAFAVYRRHLKPDGIIAVHVSNNYLRLGPVVRRLADDCGMKSTRLCSKSDESRLIDVSKWIVVTRNDDFLSAHPSRPPYLPDDDLHVPLWTDQYSNLFRILAPR